MGRRSTKENKSVYQEFREAAELTRDRAEEKMVFVTSDRIEKIENGKSFPHPDEILVMAEAYHAPELCNYFCSHECPIGKDRVPEIKPKELSQIVLDLIAGINKLNKEKERLVEITVDGVIEENEFEDFDRIREELKQVAMAADTLQLWIDKQL
ncbi:MAG: helix-turn-helix transcriptional regulator [Clostridia bacterium]|nr:helix-turn-helix transcriptional regulator [Clostridia bacterium]